MDYQRAFKLLTPEEAELIIWEASFAPELKDKLTPLMVEMLRLKFVQQKRTEDIAVLLQVKQWKVVHSIRRGTLLIVDRLYKNKRSETQKANYFTL